MYTCSICRKQYKSKYWAVRHCQTVHGYTPRLVIKRFIEMR